MPDLTYRRLFITDEGPPATGKTYFLTTAPPPVIVCDMDFGMEGVAERDVHGNEIVRVPFEMPDLDEFGLAVSQGERGVAMKEYARLKATVDAIFKGQPFVADGKQIKPPTEYIVKNEAGKLEVRKNVRGWGTLGIETGTSAYAMAQAARFGKFAKVGEVPADAWTAMQGEFARIFLQYANYTCNLIISHWQGSKYRGVVGETELKGYKQMQHLSQVHLGFEKRDVYDPQTKKKIDFEFVRTIIKSRQRPALESPSHPQHEFPVFFMDNAEKLDSIGGDFLTVAQAVLPNTTRQDWI